MSLASRQFLPLSQAEFSVYQTYERQRRQRLLGVMLPLSSILFIMASLVFTVRLIFTTGPVLATYWILYGITLLVTSFFILGTRALRRGQMTLATTLMLTTGSLGLLFIILYQVFIAEGLDAFTLSEFMLFGCVLVLVGVLGNLWAMVGATLLVNALTLVILLWGPEPAALTAIIGQQTLSITIAALIIEWLVASFLIANWLTYRQTLKTLGAAYERIQQAEQLDALKDQFITHINHELRTPIMALHGYVEYLRVTQRELSEEELTTALEKASRTGKSLLALLSSILEVRRIDGKTDTFAPEAVPVQSALDEALTLMNPREVSRGTQDVQVHLPEGLAVWGEPVRFQQILTNLISNALKYSPPGAPVQVTARLVAQAPLGTRRQRGAPKPVRVLVEVRVRDYGLGIPPEQIPLLFNRFVRLQRDLASSVEGSGLGLYLCRIMAESMGGSVWVESSGVSGEGSTFIARLPAPPAESTGS
ncbi:MAG TPA: HAMP domain-containing sensor histidine kinase [Ktedonobacterales bacterium]